MIPEPVLAPLRAQFHGVLLGRGDEGYDAARTVFNAQIDRRPLLIARCTDAADVSEAIRFAAAQRLLVSVRCTGHNIAGFAVCDDGLVVDLSLMKTIEVDAPARIVHVGAGCNWGEVNDALQPHGLAATGGFVSVTGVSGLTLGGGLGWLVRKHGLALDNLLSAEVVLADGRAVIASADTNDDLFWGLRGGGGNFGVVTRFTFRAHLVGTVLAGMVLHPAVTAPAALRRWRDLEAVAPEASTQGAVLFHFPDDPSAPPPLRGQPIVGLGGVYAGPVAEGEAAVADLRAYGTPLADLFQPMPYNAAQRMADFLWPPGLHGYWKSAYFERLDDGLIDIVSSFFARVPSRNTVIVIEHNGDGAMSRVEAGVTAFPHRRWPYNFVVTSAWTDPRESEANVAWTRELFAALGPFLADAAYVNYLGGDEGDEGLRIAYGADTLARLAALKQKYDPGNLFRMNQNVAPRASEVARAVGAPSARS